MILVLLVFIATASQGSCWPFNRISRMEQNNMLCEGHQKEQLINLADKIIKISTVSHNSI